MLHKCLGMGSIVLVYVEVFVVLFYACMRQNSFTVVVLAIIRSDTFRVLS